MLVLSLVSAPNGKLVQRCSEVSQVPETSLAANLNRVLALASADTATQHY